MSYRIYIFLLAVSITIMGILCLWQSGLWWFAGLLAVQIAVFILLVRSVRKPLEAVENGIYLLREQDFSTRLRTTGQRDADMVVELFNSLIDTMKSERLKNMEQESFLQHLIEASPSGIAVCDFNRRIVKCNPAYSHMVNDEVQKTIDILKEGESIVVRHGASQVYRCSRLWFMDSGFKRPYFLVELLTQELIDAETAIFNKIVRTMGHEVNNTLGSVVSVLETVESVSEENELLNRAVSSCRERCLNLVDFVKSYSDIVKIPDPTFQEINLTEWFESIRPFLTQMCGDSIRLETVTGSIPSIVSADPVLLERVIVNIVKNSIESIGNRDGKITIEFPHWGFTVVDNGQGIAQENIPKLFTPFFSTKKCDRGLGMMLISEVLRRHKAVFSLKTDYSTGLTSFEVKFPIR